MRIIDTQAPRGAYCTERWCSLCRDHRNNTTTSRPAAARRAAPPDELLLHHTAAHRNEG